MLAPRGHTYPDHSIRVVAFPAELAEIYPKPRGLLEDGWPTLQLTYLSRYLGAFGCKTIIIEDHYVDRDYIDDVALFYSRSLRAYPNYCYRLHFFTNEFGQDEWRDLVTKVSKRKKTQATLQAAYLGFSVVRPLAGPQVGRTVLKTFGKEAAGGLVREFSAIREYIVHLAGFALRVDGLAFQQQDRGVSACATTAVWSAMHCVAEREGLAIPTPAQITQAASRYVLPAGRSLPSEGLTIDQVCEAIRASGLAPLVLRALTPAHARAQLLGYIGSGFAPVLAIESTTTGAGHAVCGVGVKRGLVTASDDPRFHYRDAATSVKAIYIHDDRLGPYASADLEPYTADGKVKTGLRIRWPGEAVEGEYSVLTALVVPMPSKLRLTVSRMRVLGMGIADAVGRRLFPEFSRRVVLNCRYETAVKYRATSPSFALSTNGLYQMACDLVLSRYIGLIELSVPDGPLFDVVIDATETDANPSVLACVKRRALSSEREEKLQAIATTLGGRCII